VSRTENESILIEPSVNSLRISLRIKQLDDVDKYITDKFTRFLMQRAEAFRILRRKPVAGYDLSFLVLHAHVVGSKMTPDSLISFICDFMTEIDKEISEIKLTINSRARLVASAFLKDMVAKPVA
jgi:actin related protein 2/3 complex subunit 4